MEEGRSALSRGEKQFLSLSSMEGRSIVTARAWQIIFPVRESFGRAKLVAGNAVLSANRLFTKRSLRSTSERSRRLLPVLALLMLVADVQLGVRLAGGASEGVHWHCELLALHLPPVA